MVGHAERRTGWRLMEGRTEVQHRLVIGRQGCDRFVIGNDAHHTRSPYSFARWNGSPSARRRLLAARVRKKPPVPRSSFNAHSILNRHDRSSWRVVGATVFAPASAWVCTPGGKNNARRRIADLRDPTCRTRRCAREVAPWSHTGRGNSSIGVLAGLAAANQRAGPARLVMADRSAWWSTSSSHRGGPKPTSCYARLAQAPAAEWAASVDGVRGR